VSFEYLELAHVESSLRYIFFLYSSFASYSKATARVAENSASGESAVVSPTSAGSESSGGNAAKRRKTEAEPSALPSMSDPYEPFWAYFALYGEDLGTIIFYHFIARATRFHLLSPHSSIHPLELF